MLHERPLWERIQEIYGTDLQGYARWLRGVEWGGAPEIALLGHVLQVQIVVYARRGASLNRLSGTHDGQRAPDVRASVPVYWTRNIHYDLICLPGWQGDRGPELSVPVPEKRHVQPPRGTKLPSAESERVAGEARRRFSGPGLGVNNGNVVKNPAARERGE